MTFHLEPVHGRLTGGLVCGDTRVALLDGASHSIADLVEHLRRGTRHTLFCLDDDGQVVAGHVHYARRVEGDAEVLALRLDDGTVLHCTGHQLALAPDGTWREVRSLHPGDRLLTVEGPHHWSGKRLDPAALAAEAGRSVAAVEEDGTRAVYEFTVEPHHNIAHACGIFLHD